MEVLGVDRELLLRCRTEFRLQEMVPPRSKTTDNTKSDTNAVSTRNQSTTVCYTYKDKVVIDYQFRCEVKNKRIAGKKNR